MGFISQFKAEELTGVCDKLIKLVSGDNNDQIIFYSLECLKEVAKDNNLRKYVNYDELFLNCQIILDARKPTDKKHWQSTMNITNNILSMFVCLALHGIESTEYAKKLKENNTNHSLRLTC